MTIEDEIVVPDWCTKEELTRILNDKSWASNLIEDIAEEKKG